MRIALVGDVVGSAGRRVLRKGLKRLREEHRPDLVIVNGENAAGGAGLTPSTADEIFRAGADVITTGNHVWDRKEILPHLESEERLLRPANYPEPAPGRGFCIVEARDGIPVGVVNLMGRVFLSDVDDPFRASVEDGMLYGLGSLDMKCGVAGLMVALKAIRNMGLEDKVHVSFQAVSGEEKEGDGTRTLIRAGEFENTRAVIVGEGFGGQMVADAKRMIGIPYLWGGTSGNGIDCSGRARLLHRWVGVDIPRDADMQHNTANPVEPPFEIGDLFFFGEGDSDRRITHVGISLSGWKMMRSSRGRNGVYMDDIQKCNT